MNPQLNSHGPLPTPLCAAYAPLLPLLDTDALSAGEEAATREHVAGCRWCQRELAEYAALTNAVRRVYGADAPTELPISLVVAPTDLRALAARSVESEFDDHEFDDLKFDDHEFDGHEFDDGEEREWWPASRADDADLPVASPISPPSAPSVRRQHLARRLRPLGAVAAVLLILLFAGLLLSPFSPLVPGGGRSTSLSTLAPGVDQIVFAHFAPWGMLTIDGQAAPNPELLVESVALPRGQNTLVYQAAPFPTLRCVISAPAASTDTCPLLAPGDAATPDLSPATPTTRIVDLQITPQRLLPAAQAQLIAAIQRVFAAYTSTAQVLPGDHYASATGQVEVATAAFPISLTITLPAVSVNTGSQVCDPLCDSPGVQPDPHPGLHLGTFPVPEWQYTAADGTSAMFEPAPSAGNSIDISALWAGAGWQINISPTLEASTFCELTLAALPNPANNGAPTTQCGPYAASPANGSVMIVTNGQSGAPRGIILYRAGVVLAANAVAASLFPTAIVADANEAAIAQQLAAEVPA